MKFPVFTQHALMHVRWQHRAAYLRNKDQAHWAATLVENVRIGDRMTERYVAYLAGIGERDVTLLGPQCGFWERVTRQLDRLSKPPLGGRSQPYRESTTRKSAMSDATAI
jgi:hypothetical protein